MATPKRADVVAELQALRDGIASNLATFSFVIESRSYSGSQILVILDTFLASARAISEAQHTLKDALAADKRLRATASPSAKMVKDMIALMYASSPSMLLQFGMQPKKVRAPLTTETLLLRAAKSRATRAKRRTLGKRQRLAIKGNVTGVVITPVSTPPEGGSDGGSTE